MRQQNKRLTPFGRLVSKALIDRDMTRRALAAAVGDQPAVSELHSERDAVREAVHRRPSRGCWSWTRSRSGKTTAA